MEKINQWLVVAFVAVGLLSIANAQDVRKMEKDIQALQKTQTSMFEGQLRDRVHKIVNTTEFVRSANVSLNALVLSNSLTDYLNDVSSLNNPTNQELGFSLTQTIIKNLEQNIFKGRKKAGGGLLSKCLSIVKNVIEKPITKIVTTAVPVVGAMNSVSQMVYGMALRDDKISVDDVDNFRNEIGKFIAHYERLAIANRDFTNTVNSVRERTISVQMLLRNFTYQRLSTLRPAEFNPADEFDAQKIVDEKNFRNIMLHDYERNVILGKVNEIIRQYANDGNINFETALADKQLEYPDYIIGEAKFIVDEIEAISEEYILAFNRYQENVEHVLEQSKDIGDAAHIDRKIQFLREKLEKVEEAFINAVHVEEVAYKFRQLVEAEQAVGLGFKF